MPDKKTLNSDDKRRRKATEVQLFARAIGRKTRTNADPNDRQVDQKVAAAVARLDPVEFDNLLRDEGD